MTEVQNEVLGIIKTLGIASSLEICKKSEYVYSDIKKALRVLYRSGVLDTDDDGSYFIVSK